MAVGQTTQVARRRLMYGANVAVQIVLVAAAVVAVIWLTQSHRRQVDLTSSGLNSLSSRTTKLLAGLSEDVTITGIYTVLSEYDQRAQKRRDSVRDLLSMYESAGRGRVTANLIDPMKDRVRLPVLLKRLREKPGYKEQSAAHEAALRDFAALNPKILALVDEQVATGQRMMDADASLRNTPLAEIDQELGRVRRRSDDTSREVQELQGADIPQVGRAVESVRQYLDSIRGLFQAVTDWAQKKAPTDRNVPPQVLDFAQKASAAYAPLMTEIGGLLDRTKDLKAPELEEVVQQLNRWSSAPPILVETASKAVVVPFNDVWPMRSQPVPGRDTDEREFAGEQAVSSAIIKLTQKERTAVVFARFAGPSPIVPDFSQMNMMNMRQLPRAPYGTLNDLLGKENFITEDWDLSKQKTPPKVEGAARTIYVVFPPTKPQQQDPRQPPTGPTITAQDVQAVTDAVDSSGMAIFLTGWIPPEGPPGMGESKYEYGDYLSSKWGVDVLSDYVVLPFLPSANDPNLFVPTRETQRGIISGSAVELTRQEIAKPLQGSAAGLDAVCPLKPAPADNRPPGVTIEPVVDVGPTTDMWAMKELGRLNEDFRTLQGTYRRPDELAPPFSIALAVERGAATSSAPATTAPSGARLVVFGSSTFVSNPMLEMFGGFVMTGSGLQTYLAYPANADLFINALHWLTHNADRIAEGARRGEVPRLDRLKEGAVLSFWRVFLVGIWPAVSLLVGCGVWLFRRR